MTILAYIIVLPLSQFALTAAVVVTISLGFLVAWLPDRVLSGIVDTFVFLLSCHVDSLIVRKCGLETAKRASSMSAQVLDTSDPHCEEYQQSLSDLDFWLRSDGNRRNPGTMADLVTAGLFVVLRDQRVRLRDTR